MQLFYLFLTRESLWSARIACRIILAHFNAMYNTHACIHKYVVMLLYMQCVLTLAG